MSERRLNVLCVVGTSAASSATHAVIGHIAQGLSALGDDVDVFDPNEESLPLFNPQSSYSLPGFVSLKKRVERADAYVFGTPDYHGSVSSTLKNFLDHFWHEFAGKLFAQVVCSHEKGLTVIDQLRTVARQCYAWSLPYGISFSSPGDVKRAKLSRKRSTGGLRCLCTTFTSTARFCAGNVKSIWPAHAQLSLPLPDRRRNRRY